MSGILELLISQRFVHIAKLHIGIHQRENLTNKMMGFKIILMEENGSDS